MKPKILYKITLVIWSDEDLSSLDLKDLGYEADSGCAYCSESKVELIIDPTEFPQTDFFDYEES